MENRIKEKIIRIAQQKSFTNKPFFYLYDIKKIKKQLSMLKQSILPNVSIYYAIKANSNKEILKIIKNNKVIKGFEVASVGELEKALTEVEAAQVLFTGPGKRVPELFEAVKQRIRFINVESLTEIHRINQIAQEQKVGKVDILIRINPNYRIQNSVLEMTGFSTKLGIDERYIPEVIEQIKKIDHINVKGIHVFAASGILDYNVIVDYIKYIFNLVSWLERDVQKLDIVDFGGGLGIDYFSTGKKFDTSAFFSELNDLIIKYKFQNKEFILELGRYIVGKAGYYVSEIIDIKESYNKKQVILSGGINHLRLIKKHPFTIIHMAKDCVYEEQPFVNKNVVDINGPLCFNGDKLYDDLFIDCAHIGDLFVVHLVGAYGYNMASLNFLEHPKPEEVFYYSEGE
ncbi:MAG: alanine racemase [bacterium]